MSFNAVLSRQVAVENIVNEIQQDFTTPAFQKSIQYETPKGKFTVTVAHRDVRTETVLLLFSQQNRSITLPNGENINQASGTGHQHEIKYCKSHMAVVYDPDMQPDLKKTVEDVTNRFNEVFVNEIALAPFVPNVFGLIDSRGAFHPFNPQNLVGKSATAP